VIAWPVVAALVVLAGTLGGSGVVLLRSRTAVVSGALLLVAAVAGAAGLVARVSDAPDPASKALFTAAALLAAPLAVCLYPRADLRHPVDFVAAATVGSAGLVAVATANDAESVTAMAMLSVTVLICRLWWRLERGPRDERGPLLWLTFAFGTASLVAGVGIFAMENSTAGGAIGPAAFAIVGPAMAVGLWRPDVVDVRGLIVHAVVIGVTVLLYVAVFSGVVSTLKLAGAQDPPVGTLGLVGAACALGFHPATVVLRGVIDQLLFGDRPDPLTAATQVADRIGDDPVLALRAIREALVLPYASLRAEGQTLATSGTEVTHTRTLPLRLGDDAVGEMVVGLRAGELMLSADDEHVLRIVAPLLAQTLRATALARDLQESRGAAIAAIEDERRRLRRDLHDGLGPTLTGVAFSADASRNHLSTDAEAADALLARLRDDTAGAISEVRRLVEGLRPATLDELGLVGAVRQHAASLHAAEGKPLEVTIDTPETLPDLSAAAEVAAYRIVVESLTNVARHAGATKVQVSISADEGLLHLSVRDDGVSAKQWKPGVGLSSMRERAEQVGGSVVASARHDGGRVDAIIPL
jgi:signal transduction histidine kinase